MIKTGMHLVGAKQSKLNPAKNRSDESFQKELNRLKKVKSSHRDEFISVEEAHVATNHIRTMNVL